jgi:hypothetical protein
MKFLRIIYQVKFHFDIATSQISWITGKSTEVALVIAGMWYFFGVKLTLLQTALIFSYLFCIFVSFGYFLRKKNIYDIEQKVNAGNNPVQNEIYNMALTYNKKVKK